jgi:hypothetical protein
MSRNCNVLDWVYVCRLQNVRSKLAASLSTVEECLNASMEVVINLFRVLILGFFFNLKIVWSQMNQFTCSEPIYNIRRFSQPVVSGLHQHGTSLSYHSVSQQVCSNSFLQFVETDLVNQPVRSSPLHHNFSLRQSAHHDRFSKT